MYNNNTIHTKDEYFSDDTWGCSGETLYENCQNEIKVYHKTPLGEEFHYNLSYLKDTPNSVFVQYPQGSTNLYSNVNINYVKED